MTDQKQKALVAVSERGLQVENLDGLYRLAQAVAAAPDMRPKSMDTPEKCMVAMAYGMELGLAPMQAVNAVAVVNGKPSVYGETLIAVANASGLIKDVKEHFDGKGDDLTAYCHITRKDGRVTVGSFSVDDAKEAGLWSPEETVRRKNYKTGEFYDAKNDSPWRRYPKRMLMWRARGFAYRDGVPEALRGLWFREEANDIPPMRDVTPQEAPTEPDPLLVAPQATESTGTNDEPASAGTSPEDAPEGGNSSTTHADPSGPPDYAVEWIKGETKLSQWVAGVKMVLDQAADPYEAWQDNLTTFTALMNAAKDEKAQGALQALQDHATAKIKAIEQADLLSAG